METQTQTWQTKVNTKTKIDETWETEQKQRLRTGNIGGKENPENN